MELICRDLIGTLPTPRPRVPLEMSRTWSPGQETAGQAAYASAGIGSVTHLAGELLKLAAKIDMLHVPFKGAGPATIDVVGDHTNLMFGGLLATVPHIRSGKLRPLGVGSIKRNSILPDVASINDAGVPGTKQ